MKMITHPVTRPVSNPRKSAWCSMQKENSPPDWFDSLAFLTYMVAKDFNDRADVVLDETPDAYHITVQVREEAR
jgi:hypothetical protein